MIHRKGEPTRPSTLTAHSRPLACRKPHILLASDRTRPFFAFRGANLALTDRERPHPHLVRRFAPPSTGGN